ncbi:MAG: YcfA family protein [Berkelbacteria bacterium GW2011_GWA2_35_9]|uniref:YcfA family protein n=1 Tax=Berkelbacteria bacterium GW2011_GWA2_35_9 TaxID=1618333 RepID=A0A0G0FK88_9BACT|nr:MAG: YcfA family protein [Berkelbacteria bacterium GW2011_GWA2_35_9]
MPKLPRIKPKVVIRRLKKAGFVLDHIVGSHQTYIYPNNNLRVTVPYHSKDLKPKTLKSILDQANLSVEEFIVLK